ncbi:hypothetical protein QE152_g38685 [Popillia japonica]|uniref:Uncharacterized protein n=1 Tax=Popillia japonica TaxID=7064 RepID=A0AAW1HVR0_POPJA
MTDNNDNQLEKTFLKKVSEALEYLNKRKYCAADINPDLVKYIPSYTLKNLDPFPSMLLDIWPFISIDMQEEVKDLLPCLQHYERRYEDYDCVNDIPIAIKNCKKIRGL